ncbi:DEAD/DEAH box helicase [Nodosilinea sp. LEGE 07088]|uniref:DEAD/DEAH box helicase n=1 Tax=Nodosilinea sp. LEGE 07088 TaxID=2777968 RepID=UPI00187F571D|nr:DEAD/DEAH box helicase [Nodosilinea sp. LEGE 07088]MBE9139862.1 DEAD/DEAH box helicase [Nodosilinea sp. LEGE 07088]
MAILHVNWVPEAQRLFLWAESWQPLPAAGLNPWETLHSYPYALPQAELAGVLAGVQKQLMGRADSSTAGPFPTLLTETAPGKGATKEGGNRRERSPKAAQRGVAGPAWGELWLPLPAQITPSALVPVPSVQVDAAPNSESDPGAETVLHPWRVPGWHLDAADFLPILLALPLGQHAVTASGAIGADLRYWGHVTRWGLNLLARGKFLPDLKLTSQILAATWQPLLDSAPDQERLRHFAKIMPLVCRTHLPALTQGSPTLACGSPLLDPPPLLLSFLATLIDYEVRQAAQSQPSNGLANLGKELPLQAWLQALSQPSAILEASAASAARLKEALTTWTSPLQTLAGDPAAQFRLRLVLQPPPTLDQAWQLRYQLQSTANPDWRLGAEPIWQQPVAELHHQGYTLEAPQETLLAALGRAARFYDPIRESLHQQHPTHCELDPIQAYQFVKAAAWQLQDNGVEVELPPGLAPDATAEAERLGLKVHAEVPPQRQRQRLGLKSLLNFRWELSIAGETLSAEEFEQLINQGSPLVEINNRWVELKPQDVKAARQFLAGQKTATPLSVEDALRISTGDTQLIDKLPVVSFEATGALQTLIETLTTGNQTLGEMEAPSGFKGQLRPYQARGVSWLAFLEQWGLGACLADDMGLGKTIQLIAFLLYLQDNGWLDSPVLLVCPTSVLGNWEKEVKRFAPKLKTLLHHGDRRAKGSTFANAAQGQHLVITSYALVYRDLKSLQAVNWQCLVLDEAQNIKNSDAKQSKAVRQIEAQFRVALTGTPVENRLGELWSIMDFLNPGYLGPKNFFQRRFATPIERYGDTASLRALKGLVQPFILRRLKTDRTIIQDLPEKQEMTVFCGMSAEQANLYQQTVDRALATLDDATGVQRKGQILALLTKLKQICNHPAQFLQEPSLGLKGRSGKLQRLDEMLEELIAEDDRALIFTQFAEWGKLLQRHLQSFLGQEALFLYGSTTKNQREAMVDRFQNDPAAPRLFILSLKAGGVGLNLTRANHVFHYDRWWNPAIENQATDRAFRIGQTRNVQVHKFVTTGTLEERIHEMIESKKALSEQVVSAGEGWLTEFDTDQLRNLLLLDRNAIIDDDGD